MIYSAWLSSNGAELRKGLPGCARVSTPTARSAPTLIAAQPAAAKLGADRVMTGATVGTALVLVLFAIAREPATGLIASVFAGISWVAAIATLNVLAQFALPGWIRGRRWRCSQPCSSPASRQRSWLHEVAGCGSLFFRLLYGICSTYSCPKRGIGP